MNNKPNFLDTLNGPEINNNVGHKNMFKQSSYGKTWDA